MFGKAIHMVNMQNSNNWRIIHLFLFPFLLSLRCSQSGRVIDHFEIDKQNDQLWPKLALPQPALQPELVLWGRRLSPAVYPLREGRCWYIPLQSFFEASGGHLQPRGDAQIANAAFRAHDELTLWKPGSDALNR